MHSSNTRSRWEPWKPEPPRFDPSTERRFVPPKSPKPPLGCRGYVARFKRKGKSNLGLHKLLNRLEERERWGELDDYQLADLKRQRAAAEYILKVRELRTEALKAFYAEGRKESR